MGANKLYVTVEPAPGATAGSVREAMPAGGFFRWVRVEDGLLRACRHSMDRGIVRRMLEATAESVRRAVLVEVADTAMTGTVSVYERVGEELVLVDRTTGGEAYGRDVANYAHWRYGIDATS
jgi:hypothetical protein